MNIAVIGTGYVGLVTGTCFAELGHSVVCMDIDERKINDLKAGRVPIYEVGLAELIRDNKANGRLAFTASLAEAVNTTEVVFLAIGTPQGADGSADLSMILAAADEIGRVMDHALIIVQKSTCPVGTARKLESRVARALETRNARIPFDVVSNPEFLREGNAVHDFLHPDRVVIGSENPEVAEQVASLYGSVAPQERLLIMDLASAELTKYAANAFLATKISFINDIANLCELVGANIDSVRLGVGSDGRIGSTFLAAGIGYGGSCFPKDVDALLKTSSDSGHQLRIVRAAHEVNREQRQRQIEKVVRFFGGSLQGRRIAVLGLAFKPGTDDMREAPAVPSITELLQRGAQVVAYDPAAINNARLLLGETISYAKDVSTCAEGADAVILMTEWPEFLSLDLGQLGLRMKQRVIFDFRNGLSASAAREAGFAYFGVGRPRQSQATALAGE